MNYLRLTDNDTRLGPLTIGERSKTWRALGITLESGDEEHPGASVMLRAFGWSVRLATPAIIKPWRRWVNTSMHAWSNASGGHWDVQPREYGFILSNDGFLQVFYGAQTGDSTTEQNWCKHLPWTQWRYVGTRYYGLAGELIDSIPHTSGWTHEKYEDEKARVAKVPKAIFRARDYDGQEVLATCVIEESECHFGAGWFTWLALLRRPRLRRSMRIEFDREVGSEKGSWKGGLMGTGIDLQPGELHESAFKRFCAAGVHNKGGLSSLTFIGAKQ